MYERTRVTLNISSAGVRLLSLDGRRVSKWGSLPLPSGLVRDGVILRPKVVGTVINALFKSTGAPKKRVIVSLSGLSFIHRVLRLPRVERDSLPEAIQRSARKEMVLPPEELYLDWQAIGADGDETSYFVLGVPRHPVDVLLEALAGAEITPFLLDLNPLALARLADREEAIIVNLEPDGFDIVLVTGGMPAIMHTIAPRHEGATLEDNLRRLADDLLKTVEFYNNNHPQRPINPATPLLLTGELSAGALSAAPILSGAGHPVSPLKSPLEAPQDFPAAPFAGNIGLALKKWPARPGARGQGTGYYDINLNILSGKYGPRVRRLKLPHTLLSLALIIGLGLLLPMSNLKGQAGAEMLRLQNEMTAANQQLRQAQQATDAAGQTETAIKKMLTDTASARQEFRHISGGQNDFAANLKLVTDALPAQARFTSVDVADRQITVKGTAASVFNVVDYVAALEALHKYAEVRIVSMDDNKGNAVVTPGTEVIFTVAISRRA